MESQIAKLIEHIRKLEEAVEKQSAEMANITTANTALVQQIANQIELKLDLLCNGEASQQSPPKKVKNKNIYFKDVLKENINAFLGELYSQEDLDRISETVKPQKTEALRISKISVILFGEIKQDEARYARFNEIYEQYKTSE